MENLFIDILELTLPVSVLIGILLMFSPLLKNSYVAKWRYYMWLFAGVRLILPFRLTPSTPITIPVEMETAVSDGFSATRVLTLVWLIGTAVIGAYQFYSYFSFKRLIKRWGKRITDERALTAFEEAKEFAGVKGDIGVKKCRAVTSPMMFGVIKPELIIPDTEYDIGDLPVILRHELVHLKRHDIWYKLIMLTARTIHWFNPIVHIMYKYANKDIELACDEEVVKGKDSEYRQYYCRAILNFVHNGCRAKTELSTCFIFSKKAIKERFNAILSEKIKKKGIFMFCIVAVSIALSGSFITFAAERVSKEIEENLQIVERPTPPPEKTPLLETVTTAPKESEPSENVGSSGAGTAAAESYAPKVTSGTSESRTPAPEVTADKADAADLNIPDEPDSVSIDGSKETYTMPDGSTAIVQYENGEPETGYILVE